MICSSCEKNTIKYANAFFKLCIKCNQDRLRLKNGIKKPKAIKSKSDTKLNSVKQEVREEGGPICKGCLGNFFQLDVSHLIPISISPSNKYTKENMQLLCRSCHNKWENGTLNEKKKLICFDSNLEKIKQLDVDYYNRLKAKYELD